nr:peptidase M28 family protein [Arenimonas sp.]
MRVLTVALLLSLNSLCFANDSGLNAQAIANAESLKNQAMQGSKAFTIVESLTTEIGPRMAGSEAYD